MTDMNMLIAGLGAADSLFFVKHPLAIKVMQFIVSMATIVALVRLAQVYAP